MASINLLKLRQKLPYGSLVRIGESTGIHPTLVGQVLNYGWHPHLRAQVCDAALAILDETKLDTDLLKHAAEHDVFSAHSVFVPRRKRKFVASVIPDGDEDLNWDDLLEMDFDELSGLCEELELDTDPNDFQPGVFTTEAGREDELRNAIADELGIEDEDEDEENE